MKKIEKLFIYEIAGEIASSREELWKGFLGCWNEAGHSYLFFSEPGEKVVDCLLKENPQYKFVCETKMDYEQWEPTDPLRPFDIPPLSIVPAWMSGKKNSMEIYLDPGVVFGAGTHNTTHKCLEFLVSLMKKRNINSVIDLGTGTGILALAAAKLGASEVTAIDNNNLAIETASRNAALNKLHNQIHCVRADAAEYLETKADLTLANLIMWELEKIFAPHINFNSNWYIVSGIKQIEVNTFKQLLKKLPLEIARHETENLWSTLLLKKI